MSVSPPDLQPKEIQTRFLYPFFFDRDKAIAGADLLSEATIPSRSGQPINVWEACEPSALYREELLDHVDRFLFQSTERGCRYLRVSSPAGNKWFNKVQAVLVEPLPQREESSKPMLPGAAGLEAIIWQISLVSLAAIEVFLTNYGVGVLSISLCPDEANLDVENVTLFNYKLAQLRPQVSARLHIPHPSENQRGWEQMSAQHRAEIVPIPASNAPVADRLGCAGASFRLGELVTEILLKPLGSLGLKPAQGQFSVYTVVRFGEKVDFDSDEISRALASFLSGISQIEEPKHAGSPIGVVGVTNAILNRRHSAAVGLLGMAHIVSDQPIRDLSFNEQRVPRVMIKYFVPYLVALLQRMSLQRSIREAGDLVLDHGQDVASGLSNLRRHLLEFAVEGYFPEISHREVLDRYYRMVQDGLGVRRAYRDVSRAIANINAQFTADHQAKLAETMGENVAATRSLQEQMTGHLHVMANVQAMVGWIEVFFVSVYLADLWEIFASHVDRLHHWIPHGVVAGAVLGGLGAALIFRPWKHRRR